MGLMICDHDISRDLATWPLPVVAGRGATWPRALCADVWLQHLSWSEHCNCAWHGRLKPYECGNCQLLWPSDYLVVIFSTIRRYPLVFSFSRCKVQSAECTVSHWSSEKEPRQWDQRRNNATTQWRVLLQAICSLHGCIDKQCKIPMFCQDMDSP